MGVGNASKEKQTMPALAPQEEQHAFTHQSSVCLSSSALRPLPIPSQNLFHRLQSLLLALLLLCESNLKF